MKKIYFRFLLVFFTITIASCSSDSSPEIPVINKSLNKKSLGDSANDLLSDANYTSLNLEIVFVSGFAPTQRAIENLKTFLEERTYKPDGINITYKEVASSENAPFNSNEVIDIEDSEREFYNTGDDISVYIYFADGSNEDDTENRFILGSAYRNTSMVIYKETINNYSNRINAPDISVIETAVLTHEFGHLFGLVNIGSDPQSDHEDPDSEHHCTEENCLMRASLEFGGSIIDEIRGTPPVLGPLCIEDLRANGGK
ncbi:hypothetical protein [Zunongwangia sp.]|uniref:hypothetical protein n=1 Tax=Zunongwangia sp. TaxID=1965325 RepID=UPI003AA8E9B1